MTFKNRTPRILAMVLAGGKGERLYPLTRTRSKPAVPFGGTLRIIDFVLSNLVHSRISSIYVLVQYRSQSLLEHLDTGWRIGGRLAHHFITAAPPQMRVGETWYRGTADAVYQNLPLVLNFEPDLVAVFGADHIYRMDVTPMVRQHLKSGAGVTVAALPVPREDARGFGVMAIDEDKRITAWLEKPEDPPPMPGDRHLCFASMGNYLFDPAVLHRALEEDAGDEGTHDFGRDVIPRLVERGVAAAFDFRRSAVPGLAPHEDPHYWRDVGTLEAYHAAHMDLLGSEPALHMHNRFWPILGARADVPPSRFLGGSFTDVVAGGGSSFFGGILRRSVIGRRVVVEKDAVIEHSIVGDGCVIRRGARLRRVVLDRFNEVPSGQVLDPQRPLPRPDLHLSESGEGLIVVPRGTSPIVP